MYGAIIGDIIGEPYEINPIKTKDFKLFNPIPLFTDDTVLTIAVANAMMNISKDDDDSHIKKVVEDNLRYFGLSHIDAGYGRTFIEWLESMEGPYNSWGNGSAMRTSSTAWLFDDINDALRMARLQASVTHNHPEGIKGAEAVTAAIFLARTNHNKQYIKHYITNTFGYNLDENLDDIRCDYIFDVSCQGSVPQAIMSFLEASDYEDAVRNAVSLGGDSDTQAAIAGSIAEAYWGIPDEILKDGKNALTNDLLSVCEEFDKRMG